MNTSIEQRANARKQAAFAWKSMSRSDRMAFYSDEYDQEAIAERFGSHFLKSPAYNALVEICNNWIADPRED